jgi:NADH dehydrogenase (ubiquinone) 1 alpha subcomplex subunit 5
MRSTIRLLAKVQPARYLEPRAPTGLTGLVTHPSPRPTLIYLYTTTLEKLKALPETSVYRQATDSLTRHRLQVVESTKPPGFDAWLERVKKTVAAKPEHFQSLRRPDGSYAAAQQDDPTADPRGVEWDGERMEASTEGPARTPEEEARWHQLIEQATATEENDTDFDGQVMRWESEPALEAEQYVFHRAVSTIVTGDRLTVHPGSLKSRTESVVA